ncbi:hypothetical protein [Acrocarpospora catenulata]|uniref:hypothetical protein n=1 Tax=Acrocarpospora catenulata TaxID=2836182 RepID=UPI001BD9D981|nr:hypothetical protein [Acrocarpospora catenulata]
MRITLRGTPAEIDTAAAHGLLIILPTSGGDLRVMALADPRVFADPYSDLARLDANLITRTEIPTNGIEQGAHQDDDDVPSRAETTGTTDRGERG